MKTFSIGVLSIILTISVHAKSNFHPFDNRVDTVPCPADTSYYKTKCVEESLTLTARPGVSYSWSPSTGLSSTTIQNPLCTATSAVLYTVTITRSDSCHFKDYISVGVNSCHCEDTCNWSLTGNSFVKPWSYLGSRNDADIFFRRYNVSAGRLGLTNTAFGVSGASPTSPGAFNSSYGASSFSSNTTGQYNVANGFEALHANTSGQNNTAIGFDALASNSTGSNNTAVGFRSLLNNVTDGSTAVGMYSLASNTTGYGNCATGFSTLMNNTTGTSNVANGTFALQNNNGSDNIAVGYNSLNANTSGSQNSALGTNALLSNTTGIYNVAIGHRTLTYNVNGQRNIAIGGFALDNNIAGNNNIGIGLNTLRYQTGADNNVSIGEESGTDITTGGYNTFLGAYTGLGITNGSYNTILGGNVSGLTSGLSNTIILADGAGTKRLFINNAGFAGLATVAPTAALHVNCTGISTSNPSNVRFENLQTGSGHFLVIDNNGYVLTSAESGIVASGKEIEELKQQVVELQQQVKELIGTKALNPVKVPDNNKNSLEIIPSPFVDNAKAVYHIENFRSNAILQIVSSTGVVMKTYSLYQADGQIEIGKLPAGTGVVTFSLIADGKNIISKQSVKI